MNISTKHQHVCSTFARHKNTLCKRAASVPFFSNPAAVMQFNQRITHQQHTVCAVHKQPCPPTGPQPKAIYRLSIKFIMLTVGICISTFIYGQITITGKVVTNENIPLEFASIKLVHDSSTLLSTLTDSSGNFKLVTPGAHKYKLIITYLHYNKSEILINLINDTIVTCKLTITSSQLNEISITAKRPIFERKSDKFIFNVSNLKTGKGNNAWDILSQTPLVATSEQGGVSISGTEGATVFINGRKSFLSGDALVNYLKGISSENVLHIEVITIPSSKFESAGGGGVINIVLKKNDLEGLKGSITLTDNQTTYNSQHVNSDINFRKKKINVYSYISSSNQNLYFNGLNNIYYKQNSTSSYISENYINRKLKNKFDVAPTIGIDYQLTKKETVGLLFEYATSSLNRYNTTNTNFKNPITFTTDSIYQTISTNKEKTNYFNANVNYAKQLDSTDGLLNISYDHLKYNENRSAIQNTNLLDNTGDVDVNKDHFSSVLPQKINNNAFSIDLSKALFKNISIETGGRYSNSQTDNNVRFSVFQNNREVNDTTRSNHFKYTENIYALYGLLKHALNNQWDYQLGLRAEKVLTTGKLINKNQVTDNSYTNYFPTAFLNYSPNENHQFSISYTERINRPSFWDINPFRYYTSQNIYMTGNPFLLPSKVYKEEFTYTYKSKIIIQLMHSLATNAFANLTYSDSVETYQKQTNFGTKDITGISFIYTNRIKPFWFFRLNANFSYISYKGNYQNNLINQSTLFPAISMLHGFTISKEKKLYSSINMSNNFQHYSQNILVKNQFIANISVTKISKNNKLQYSLSLSDIFKSSADKYFIEQPTQNITEQYYYDARGVSLSIKYNFGSQKIKNQRERNTSNSEEKQRIN